MAVDARSLARSITRANVILSSVMTRDAHSIFEGLMPWCGHGVRRRQMQRLHSEMRDLPNRAVYGRVARWD